MPPSRAIRVWATLEAVLEQPNGKSTTTHTPVAVPSHRGAAISTDAGLTQTVLQPYLIPFSTSRRISSGVNSGLSTEWST